MVKIKRKIIIDQNPKAPIFPKDIAQGKRNAISKSKIINKIFCNRKIYIKKK